MTIQSQPTSPLIGNVSDQVMTMVRNELSLLRRDALAKLFDPRRDVDKECGYPQAPQPLEYKALWDREGLAKRCVSILPMECWSIPPSIYEDEDETEPTDFEDGWNKLQDRLNLFAKLEKADILSGIGRYGVLLLGFADGLDLRQPVAGIGPDGKMAGAAKVGLVLNYVRVLPEHACVVGEREHDINNPRFGQPTFYTLTLQDTGGEFGALVGGSNTLLVHWSRVIHVADDREESEVFGIPRLQCVFNRLMDIKKVLGGSGEMFWKGALPGLTFDVNPGIENPQMDTNSIREEVEKYMNGLQRYIALEGLTAKSLTPQIGDPRYHVACILENIALSLGVPKRVFLGSEEGKLASGQDMETWNRRLARRQNTYVTPMIIRPFLDRLIIVGVLPAPLDADFDTGDLGYKVWWQDLNTTTEGEKATVAVQMTTALSQYVAGGVEAVVPPKEFLTIVLGYDKEQADEILQAAEEHQAVVDQQYLDQAALDGQAQTITAENAPAPEPGQPITGNEDLAVLVQFTSEATLTDNAWSDEARAASIATRQKHADNFAARVSGKPADEASHLHDHSYVKVLPNPHNPGSHVGSYSGGKKNKSAEVAKAHAALTALGFKKTSELGHGASTWQHDSGVNARVSHVTTHHRVEFR